MTNQPSGSFRSGFVTIIGRPNVGKSTLVNLLVGEKIAIVSPRPQTTRNRIMGVVNQPGAQLVLLDTPGIHKPKNRLGDYMSKAIDDAMQGIDALVLMVDASDIRHADKTIAQTYAKSELPCFLVINKIDLVHPQDLLSIIHDFSNFPFRAILPISARKADGIDVLMQELVAVMPEGPRYFPEDMMTDQPERVLCAEIIREKALLNLNEEIPHGVGVEILSMKSLNENFTEIHATLYCERESHKRIIIGKQGSMIQKIGTAARRDIENLLAVHVHLDLWVKVRPGWRDSLADLKNLGYSEN